ncbi:MAG TPA: HD domain-containing protein [Flavitalea sp.]|nr:HD domain-containing protein [Flavitalea sp.]
MISRKRKIINDPVHGFITLDHPLILDIVAHPYYQRLRRITQMAFAHLVYPGAMHTRLHHSLGAYHLMTMAIGELKNKGFVVTEEEEVAAKVAILLHDSGHAPFSHALERILLPGIHHESISLMIMKELNGEFNGQLDLAIQIFTHQYHKPFLSQLVSGQLDVDRLDYLTRDSFFTGVSEGVVGYDRIIKMLTVHEGQLMVEEKGIYSIEKFLVARRLMYWQVYLHKTVLAAEMMLVKIIQRAKELLLNGYDVPTCSLPFDYFLVEDVMVILPGDLLNKFCLLDDYDVMMALKNWMSHSDLILSTLCRMLIERRLLKVKLQSEPIGEDQLQQMRNVICHNIGISERECRYFLFTGEAENTTYNSSEEKINILFKDGTIRNISAVDHALIQQTLSTPVKKFYICYLN